MSDPYSEAAFLLDQARTACLATADAQGDPHAANVQFVHLGRGQLLWASKPTSAHSEHLRTRPAVALTVYGHADVDPDGIHGVQLRGQALPVALDEALWRAYVQRFPVAAAMRPAFDAGRQQLYRFEPTWIRWIDNRRGFGFKLEHPKERPSRAD